MSYKFRLLKKGFVFWPVGTGDSTTIVVAENEINVQIDLHHMEKACRLNLVCYNNQTFSRRSQLSI